MWPPLSNSTVTATAAAWSISQAYPANATVQYTDGYLYVSNAAIPANTAFIVGIAGATWRLSASTSVTPTVNVETISPNQHGGYYGTVYRTYFTTSLPAALTSGNNVSRILDFMAWAHLVSAGERYCIRGWASDGAGNFFDIDLTGTTNTKGNMVMGVGGFVLHDGWVDYTK